MKRAWLDHCETTQQKTEFKERIAYTQDIFLLLKGMLEKDLAQCNKERRSQANTFTSNYAVFQADCNARERTLLEVIDLLPILEK